MLNVGPQELIVILIIALLVVGPQRLPELSRQLGRGLREFRKIQEDVKGMVNLDEVKNLVNLDEVKNMVTFDANTPTEPSPSSASSTPRVTPAATTPAVHRAARPAPAPDSDEPGSPAASPAPPQDG